MKYYENIEDMSVGEIEHEDYDDGTVHHLVCEGARRHVKSYDSDGVHCSCKKCEVNKINEKINMEG